MKVTVKMNDGKKVTRALHCEVIHARLKGSVLTRNYIEVKGVRYDVVYSKYNEAWEIVK